MAKKARPLSDYKLSGSAISYSLPEYETKEVTHSDREVSSGQVPERSSPNKKSERAYYVRPMDDVALTRIVEAAASLKIKPNN